MHSSNETLTASISISAAAGSFFLSAIPVLQFFALCIAIVSGLITIHKHFKDSKK